MQKTVAKWPRFHAPTWYAAQAAPCASSPPPRGRTEVGTLVIGAGLAGLGTALSLAERGITDVAVIERGEAGEGASGRNGGFVFAGYSLPPAALVRQRGAGQARRMHGWTRDAVGLVRRRCGELGVAASDRGVLLADWFGDDVPLADFRDGMRDQLGLELDWVDRERMPDYVRSRRYGAGLYEPDSFHFNPGAYARAIAGHLIGRGIPVYTHTPAGGLRRAGGRWRVSVPGAEFTAERVVLATGGYDRRLYRRAQRSIQPIATYIVVTEPLGPALDDALPADVAVYDNRFAFDYYRRLPGRRLLWGGRISTADRDPASVERLMRRDLGRVFPSLAGARFDYAWGGWMSYARHQMPILGEFEPGLWLALAFGGHGMAPTALAGEVLAEALTGDPTRLQQFQRWGPAWAGGPFGRAAVQGVYWWKQLRDGINGFRFPGLGFRKG